MIAIGEPFGTEPHTGVYVPYEIECANSPSASEVKKWHLALRNDNPLKLRVIDGGI